MRYNIYFELASFFFVGIIYFFYFYQYKNKDIINQHFKKLLIFVWLMIATDILSAITISYITLVPLWVNTLLNCIYYILNAFCSLFFLYYIYLIIEKPTREEQYHHFVKNNMLLSVYILSEIVNLFFGFFFYFDYEKGYVHGPLFIVPTLICYFYILESFVIILKYRKKISRRELFASISYTVILCSMDFAQVLFVPDVLLTGFGASLTLFIIFLTLETPDYCKLMATLEELEEARHRADAANMAKSQFLANMSHEIRTPLNSILGMNEMILRECKDDHVLEYSNIIKSSSNTLLSIINDILDLSKIESGMMEIIPADYDLQSVLADIVTMMDVKSQDKGLKFNVKLDPSLPKGLYGDELRVKQVLINLLNNSFKYTQSGSVSLEISGTNDYDIDVDMVFKVIDTGIGIKEEDMDKLFKKFERLDLKKNRSVEGTGLGLSIVGKLVELMDGKISCESEYGKGTTFTVYLQQKIVDTTPLGEFNPHIMVDMRKEHDSDLYAPTAKILAVDDNPTNLDVLKKLLKETGMQIYTSNNGKRALKMLSSTCFDIVLLDHMMPEMDGIETLHEAKKIDSETGFKPAYIALTANAVVGAKEMYQKEGFIDYISKPINPDELEHILKRYLPFDMCEKKPIDPS